ncbi:MAG: BrnT family toxin [Gallionella sp.]|nr:BrnT family toxin [Gallionella sp.]
MAYHAHTEFEWDQDKSDVCLTERGFDFAYVLHAFMDAERLIHEDTRWDYGEDRYQLLGAIDGRVFFVVYTVRGTVLRIISARKANQREVNDYENSERKN